MMIVDAHCDTVSRMLQESAGLYRNHLHVDLERMMKAGSYVQFFAAFVSPVYGQAYSMRRAVQLIDALYREIKTNSDFITLCCNYNDIELAADRGKIAAVLSIEGGDALQGDLSALRMFYKLGVRSLCLTWNHRNEIADGVGDTIAGGGLTAFGRDVVREMNSLGMLVDLSHISEHSFWDTIALTRYPAAVSHSNAKAVCGHRRNLTDDQILAVKENHGVIGINLYPEFLNSTGDASIKDVIRHIEHIAGLGGEDNIGIGADFDGIENTPDDLRGVQDIPKIFEELHRLNYTETFIRKFAGGNFLRIIKEIL